MCNQNREFRAIGTGYRLRYLREGMQFDATQLRWGRDGELWCLLSVTTEISGAQAVHGGSVSVGSFNLSAPAARMGRARDIQAALRAPELDVRLMLEDLAQSVILAERAGRPIVRLQAVTPPPIDESVITVYGLPIPLRHSTIASAQGGTGKTTLGVGICGALELSGVSTLFLDYETDEFECRTVAERLFGPEFPDLKYRRCERPLYLEAESIAQQIDECGIEYVVIDSAGYAADGRPEEAEVALRFFRALRQLRVGSWTNAHISSGDNGTEKPFGSVFWFNSARAVWYLERSTALAPANTMTVGAYQRKNNLGRLHPAVGLRFEFSPQGTAIVPVDLAEDDQLASKLPVSSRMQRLLTRGPLTLSEIANELGEKVDTVTKAATRNKATFTRILHSDGIHRIALVERRAS